MHVETQGGRGLNWTTVLSKNEINYNTMAVQVQTMLFNLMKAATELAKVSSVVFKGLLLLLSPLWQMTLWHGVAHATAILSGITSNETPFATLADDIVAWSGTGHCYAEWHNT